MSDGAERLITLLDVEAQVLAAKSRIEAAFIAVNDAHALVRYRQAVLWSAAHGVEAVSGLANPEANAPFLLWLGPVCRRLAADHAQPTQIVPADLPTELAEQWLGWLPGRALWVPLGPSRPAVRPARIGNPSDTVA